MTKKYKVDGMTCGGCAGSVYVLGLPRLDRRLI
jgi:hypothetical protein